MIEQIDFNDPLAILMARECEDDSDEDSAESRYLAGTHRAATSERERGDDMLGASPFELREHELMHAH